MTAREQIALAVKTHGASAIAKRLGVVKDTLLSYLAECAQSATTEQIDRRIDRLDSKGMK